MSISCEVDNGSVIYIHMMEYYLAIKRMKTWHLQQRDTIGDQCANWNKTFPKKEIPHILLFVEFHILRLEIVCECHMTRYLVTASLSHTMQMTIYSSFSTLWLLLWIPHSAILAFVFKKISIHDISIEVNVWQNTKIEKNINNNKVHFRVWVKSDKSIYYSYWLSMWSSHMEQTMSLYQWTQYQKKNPISIYLT